MMRLFALVFLIWPIAAKAESLRMAVTTSFHNSGLADVLLPALTRDTGIEVQLLVVGTGQALRLGRAGDVDAVLVHARAAEEAFVAEGYGPYRREIMYNDFVIVGPAADPAQVARAQDANAAFIALAQAKSPFVSRGDDSGTHRMERRLWQAAGLDPDRFGRWYRAVGSGMGASLNTASGMGAYILTDRASWLSFGNVGELALLFEGDPVLFNQYAFLPVAKDRHPHVARATAQEVEDWLTSPAARDVINGFRITGQALFVFNAKQADPAQSD